MMGVFDATFLLHGKREKIDWGLSVNSRKYYNKVMPFMQGIMGFPETKKYKMFRNHSIPAHTRPLSNYHKNKKKKKKEKRENNI